LCLDTPWMAWITDIALKSARESGTNTPLGGSSLRSPRACGRPALGARRLRNGFRGSGAPANLRPGVIPLFTGWRVQTGNQMKMPKTVVVAGLVGALALTGCVPVMYTKSVTVRRDADGKVMYTEETEVISEPHSQTPRIQDLKGKSSFEHLK